MFFPSLSSLIVTKFGTELQVLKQNSYIKNLKLNSEPKVTGALVLRYQVETGFIAAVSGFRALARGQGPVSGLYWPVVSRTQ